VTARERVDQLARFREQLELLDDGFTSVLLAVGEDQRSEALADLDAALDALRDGLFDAHLEALREEQREKTTHAA
jgi:hypothetical protein